MRCTAQFSSINVKPSGNFFESLFIDGIIPDIQYKTSTGEMHNVTMYDTFRARLWDDGFERDRSWVQDLAWRTFRLGRQHRRIAVVYPKHVFPYL